MIETKRSFCRFCHAFCGVEVDVEDLLPRSPAVRQEEVHPFTADSAPAQRAGQSVGDSKHMCAGVFIQIGKRGGVARWNHKQVPRIHRLDVHERCAAFIRVDHT